MKTLYESNINGLNLLRRGKVRDIYSIDDERFLIIVACDRISAFDSVLTTPIPEKGAILTEMSNFWFNFTSHIIPNHLMPIESAPVDRKYKDILNGEELRSRAVLVKKTEPLPVEAIVRGYISGSAWKEYKQCGKVSGITLQKGLVESEQLPQPVYTPSTKAESGTHDENISFDETIKLLGETVAVKVRDISLSLYNFAAEHALERGIIIADTKFEFGLIGNELILIDEILTPDSSRFWPLDGYSPGKSQPSFDKQYVRDYLESIGWDKNPPAPPLPEDVIEKTREKYKEALNRLTEKNSK
ncbi:MAG: phosphoribosylaminoimidazolesuccinocarboxamide synthase [bacterium]